MGQAQKTTEGRLNSDGTSGVWLKETVREWADVAWEARQAQETIHMGYLFGICVEKNSELNPSDERRKYKYRVVFHGGRVKDQNWEAAVFQELGSSPANMEASKMTDMYGMCKGHSVQSADAEQAYVQAELKGPTTWVALPPEAWEPEWKGMTCPVVILKRALYGHPDSGTYWEEHCDKAVKKQGSRPLIIGQAATGTRRKSSSSASTSTTLKCRDPRVK